MKNKFLLIFFVAVCVSAGLFGQAITIQNGQLFDPKTQSPFLATGFNYVRLDIGGGGHDTFNPLTYDAEKASEMLSALASRGYTVVRVFVNSDVSTPSGSGWQTTADEPINAAYLDKFVDFLRQAEAAGIRVLPSMSFFPRNPKYDLLTKTKVPQIENMNHHILHLGFIKAKQLYLIDFWRAVKARYPEVENSLLAIDLQNEISFAGKSPLTLQAGTFAAANGKTYDLATEKQTMLDDMVIYWIDAMSDALDEVLPDVLVNVNVFPFGGVRKKGPDDFTLHKPGWLNRFPFRPLAIARSSADIVDIHLYGTSVQEIVEDLETVEWEALKQEVETAGKVLMVGEFGTQYSRIPAEETARNLEVNVELAKFFSQDDWQGWLFWTYDSKEQNNHQTAVDEDNALLDALTPEMILTPAH